ncbi:MAG: hypothetical protein HRU15_19810, partial [Planctomycetes bacterium]|nr:hypothetical protein [Planctomycetota bacterium]
MIRFLMPQRACLVLCIVVTVSFSLLHGADDALIFEARAAYNSGQYIEAQMLLQHIDAGRSPYHVLLLQAQLFLAQGKIADFELLDLQGLEKKEPERPQKQQQRWPLELRSLKEQTLGDYYLQQQ